MALRFSRMTRPAIKALKAGEKIHEHGICAERMTNGDLRYSINLMSDGSRVHRVIGRESEGVTREQAERAVEAIRTRAREERLDLPTGRNTHRTFEQAAEEYLKQIEDHPQHGRNLARKRQHLNGRLIPFFKRHRPDKITDFTISQYNKSRRDAGASQATVNRELSSLSHFLNRCVEWKWFKERPRIPKGEEPRKKIVILNAAEQQALMQAAVADHDPTMWLFVAIALGTGMRHAEILRIKWEDIDTANRRIHVPKAKAGQREQPMPPTLAETLAAEHVKLGKPTGWLFPSTRTDAKQGNRQVVSGQFRRIAGRAKLDPKKVTPHVLRHTAITGLVKAGVDLPTIQRISGHKTLAMILRYTQLTDDHIDQSVAKLDAAFLDPFTPELHTEGAEQPAIAA